MLHYLDNEKGNYYKNNQNDLIDNEFNLLIYRVSKLFMKISYNISLLRGILSQHHNIYSKTSNDL